MMQAESRSPNPTLGTDGDVPRRLIFHYAPLAAVSALVLILFMALSSFDTSKYLPGDIFSGTFPKEFPTTGTGAGSGEHQPPQQQGEGHQPPQQQGEGHEPPLQGGTQGQGEDHSSRAAGGGGSFLGLSVRRLTVATGYIATGALALTLLIGPANLLLRRRNPISSYLTRDVGIWAAGLSALHVFFGLEVHSKITDPIPMFIRDGDPLTNSFGLANWTGLAATVIVVGLFAISSDFALRKLRARTWKSIQRLNYALFVLVAVHAFFYGALLRTDSPYTLLLVISVVAVFVGQSVGVWLWRRRHARPTAKLAGAAR